MGKSLRCKGKKGPRPHPRGVEVVIWRKIHKLWEADRAKTHLSLSSLSISSAPFPLSPSHLTTFIFFISQSFSFCDLDISLNHIYFFLKAYRTSIYGGLWDLYCHIAGFFALCCRRTQHLTSKLPWNVCDKSSVSVLSTRLEVFPRVCPIQSRLYVVSETKCLYDQVVRVAVCRLRHAHSGSPNFLLKTKTPFIQRSVAPTNCAFPIFVRMNTTYMCTYKHTCTLLQKGTSCENFDPVLCEHSCKHCLMFTSIYETRKGSRRSLSIVFVCLCLLVCVPKICVLPSRGPELL